MISRSYKKFNGIIHNDIINEYVTSIVSYRYPYHIERVYRYLRRYYPESHKMILTWNPIFEPSFGWYLKFDDDNVTLISKCASKRSHDDIKFIFNINTRRNFKSAMKAIAITISENR
jgi:hypothetical protein